jgi:2,3-bisphosphoglycerate-dependent phosphoglycerate mutase
VPICLLIRHGSSTANAAGVLAGRLPGIRLDDAGHEQVRALGNRLAALPLVRVVSSPLERCRDTAAAVLAALPGEPEVLEDHDLQECSYGAWTGRPLKELAGEPLWRTVQDQPTAARFPASEEYAGEGLLDMAHRAVAAVRAHDAAVGERHGGHAMWAAVTHGDIIKAVLADAAGAHLDHFQRFQADPASVSVVRYTGRRPFVVVANDLGGDLARLVPPPQEEAPEGDAVVGGGAGGAAGRDGTRR